MVDLVKDRHLGQHRPISYVGSHSRAQIRSSRGISLFTTLAQIAIVPRLRGTRVI